MVLLYLALALAVTGATPIPWLRVDEAPLNDELQIIGAGENDDNQVLQANQDKTFNAAQDKINASVTHILFECNTTQDWENKSTTATGPGLTNATNMEQKENSNEIGNSSNAESLNNTIFINDENEDLRKPRGEEFEKKMRIACFAILGTIIAITVVVFIWIGKRSYDYYLRPQPIKDITRNSEMKKNDVSSGEKELQNSRESEECTEVDTNVPMPECLQIPRGYVYGERQSIENTGEHEKPHNYQEREDKICEKLSGNQDVNGNKKMVKEENNTGCKSINENSQVIRSLTSGENQGKTKICIDKTFSGNQETLQTQAVCGNQGTCESRATCKNRAVCENQAICENQATYEIRVVSEYPRTHENKGTYGNQRVSEDTVAISQDQGAPEDQGASEDQEASECHEASEDQESSDYNKASKDPRTSENLDDSKDQRTCENQADSEDQRTCEDKGYSEKLGASGDEESFGHQGSYEYQGASEDKRASEVQEIPEAQGSLEDLEAFKDQRASEDQGAPGNKGASEDERTSEDQGAPGDQGASEDERTSEDQGAPEDQGSSEDQGACEDQKASEYQGTSEDLGTFKNQTVSENEAVCQYNADSKNQISCEYAVGSENQAASGNEEPFENQKAPYIQVALVFSHSVSSDSQATLESQVTLANPVTLKDQEALKKQLLLENQAALEMEVASKYLECLESSNDETENVTENQRETVEDDQYCQEELKGLSVHQEEGAIPYNLNCRMLPTYQEGLASEKVEVDQEFLVSTDIPQCQE